MNTISIPKERLAEILPMYVLLASTGHISHAGPSLCKVLGQDPRGKNFWDTFDIKNPSDIKTIKDLENHSNRRLNLSLASFPYTNLRGLTIPLGHGSVLINLSFGAHLPEAVRAHELTIGDFAVTDTAMELLCLIEVNGLVRSQLRTLNQRLQSEKTQAEIEARTDPLTGLYNRRALDAWLQDRVSNARPFGVMRLDLDHFKIVNDRFGHQIGDIALIQLADVLRQTTRTHDMIARVGGDEFVILFPDMITTRTLKKIADRIHKALLLPSGQLPLDVKLSVSIGITTSTQYDQPDPELLLADADRALYRAKRMGRGRAILHQA